MIYHMHLLFAPPSFVPKGHIQRFTDTVRMSVHVGEVPKRAAARVAEVARFSLAERGSFNVAISGGSLPRLLAEGLTEIGENEQVAKWTVFLADERIVPLDHENSNYREITRQLPNASVTPIIPDFSPSECARDYQVKLEKTLGKNPIFDAVLLGIGPDGHTCSLFPGHPLLLESGLLIAPITDSPKPPPERVTLTFPVLNASRAAIFFCTGTGKAAVVKDILENSESKLPAHLVKPTNGTVDWFLDGGAAKELEISCNE